MWCMNAEVRDWGCGKGEGFRKDIGRGDMGDVVRVEREEFVCWKNLI